MTFPCLTTKEKINFDFFGKTSLFGNEWTGHQLVCLHKSLNELSVEVLSWKNVRIRSFISIITRVMSLLSPASVAQQCRGCSLPRYDFFSVESAEECNIVAKSICKAFTFRHCMNALTNIFLNPKKHRNNCKCCPVSSVTLNCNNDCNEVRIIIYISKVTWIVPISCSQTLSVCFLLLYIFHRAHHVIHKK